MSRAPPPRRQPEVPLAAAAAAAPASLENDAEVAERAARVLSEAFTDREAAGLPDDYVLWSKLILLDAGFGSVKLAVALGKRGIHVVTGVKGAHVGFPKAWLQATPNDAPSGTWCVLEPVEPIEGVDIVAIGYKYNAKKVLFFVMTKGAGSTKSGAPYVAKFPDRYGNQCRRNVERPPASRASSTTRPRWTTTTCSARAFSPCKRFAALSDWKLAGLFVLNDEKQPVPGLVLPSMVEEEESLDVEDDEDDDEGENEKEDEEEEVEFEED